ncbi:class I SAM-dependent methyltransferase [Salinarimonas rosea]|uniref:class I SAM-dependent methyltransferase n=1 Tax=Salinarimonas rosea TaxID=552063 RepID=UPI0003FC70AB|nr:class I SAM-dependent methyltransferase [Salinarimonas rosea]
MPQPTAEDTAAIYADGYTLGAEAGVEAGRARLVRDLLRDALGGRRPGRILEIGSGRGHLLAELGATYPDARVEGIEPATALAREARERGVIVCEGGLEARADRARAAGERFGAIVAVNVMEHMFDPVGSHALVAALLEPNGVFLSITPDGERAGIELLFADHVSSFTAASLSHVAGRAGLSLVSSVALDGDLSEFRASCMRLRTCTPNAACSADRPTTDAAAVARDRAAFLGRIGDAVALERPFFVFGAGEAADLLAGYAPDIVAAAEAFVVDAPTRSAVHGRPLVALETIPPRSRLLLCVHARSVDSVARRLSESGHLVAPPPWRA